MSIEKRGGLTVILFDIIFYATLPYIRHFIFAGCYDNNHWYLVTNLAGHLDLAGFYFSKCPAKFVYCYKTAYSSCHGESPSLNILYLPGLEHALSLIDS